MGLPVGVEAPEHLGERIPTVLNRDANGVGRGEQEEPVERVALHERQVPSQRPQRQNVIHAGNREIRDADGFAFVNQKTNGYDIFGPMNQRVDPRVRIAASVVEEPEAQDVAPELALVEIPLLPQADEP